MTDVASHAGVRVGVVVFPGSNDDRDLAYALGLLGAEVAEPVVNDRCRELNFTNEGGVAGTVRLLKNIGGLWLLQECRRIWQREGKDLTWEELVREASAAEPLRSIIDPDHPRLVTPEDMPAEISALCRESGQAVPETPGAIIRCTAVGRGDQADPPRSIDQRTVS